MKKRVLYYAFAFVLTGATFFLPVSAKSAFADTQRITKERFSKGVEIDGVAVGGMKREKGLRILRKKQEENTPTLTVRTPKGDYRYTYPEIGFIDDYETLFYETQKGEYRGKITWYLKGKEEKIDKIVQDNRLQTLDATLSFSSDGFSYFPERTGIVCSREKLSQDIENALLSPKEKLGERNFPLVTLRFENNAPSVTVEELKKRTARISSFTTYYSTADEGRTKNIALAARLLDGYTVHVGQEFSFNAAVGERTKKRGFEKAKVIQDGVFVEGVGGGVCQVSTTLYNAALLAGLTVTRRAPHSLPVAYVAPSRDAMVSSLSDLRFRNTRSYPVYLSVKTGKGKITVTFYGKSDGYEYRIESKILKKISPPEEEIRYGKTEGEIKKGKEGVKSEGYLYKYKGNALLSVKRLSCDRYAPVRGIIGKKIENMTKKTA